MFTQRPTLLDIEARVLSVLVEKSLTTPDQYPLSLNALVNGCNQKSNRDPVCAYTEAEVAVALDGLTQKHLAGRVIGASSRVEKFRHTAQEALSLDVPALAVLAELMMRGPQTPGELRARVHRMSPTPTLDDLTPILDGLLARGLTRRLPPHSGARSGSVAQLLTSSADSAPSPEAPQPSGAALGEVLPAGAPPPAPDSVSERVTALEGEVAELRRGLAALREELGA